MPQVTLVKRIVPGDGSSRTMRAKKTVTVPWVVTTAGARYRDGEVTIEVAATLVTASEVFIFDVVRTSPEPADDLVAHERRRQTLESAGWVVDDLLFNVDPG